MIPTSGLKLLITGASGFIGSALCNKLSDRNIIIGLDTKKGIHESLDLISEQADLTDISSVSAIIGQHFPDVVIHCAGIAHQKTGSVDLDTYVRVNSVATEALARSAAMANQSVKFIFLSTVSVYGEDSAGHPLSEDSPCKPSSDYAASKVNAERRLLALHDDDILHDLTILRLAPVYDQNWSLNLDRRVFAPKRLAYVRFGAGRQKMSALARPNLIDFLEQYIKKSQTYKGPIILNICDNQTYEFNTIIDVFKRSDVHGYRPVINVPLPVVWLATRIAGFFMRNKRRWLHSCYEKLSTSLVFDNSKMLATGFVPRYSLNSIFHK